MPLFGGVDPGKDGALAILDESGAVVQVMATPLVETATGRDAYDLMAITRELRVWHTPDAQLFVTVEKLHPMPSAFKRAGGVVQHGGTIANFNRGLAHGWAWMLTGMGITHRMVTAQVWQRAMVEGVAGPDPKARSIVAARALWPDVDLRRSARARKDHEGFADALLIAEYGRRLRLGGTLFAAARG